MTKDKKEEESILKKKLTTAAVIVAALALILAASMFGCSKDTTAAEDKTEKTVSTENVETVQVKKEEEETPPATKPLSASDDATTNGDEVDISTEIEKTKTYDYAAIYADLVENHPDKASAIDSTILLIPSLFTVQEAADNVVAGFLEEAGYDKEAAVGLIEYLLSRDSSDRADSNTTSQPSNNTSSSTSNSGTSNSGTGSTGNSSTSTPSTPSKPSSNTSSTQTPSQPSSNTSSSSNSSSSSSSSNSTSSGGFDFDAMIDNAIANGTLEQGTGVNVEQNYETEDTTGAYADDWDAEEVIIGDNGTITIIK